VQLTVSMAAMIGSGNSRKDWSRDSRGVLLAGDFFKFVSSVD
jgi:hypothetical protein